jgi:hypothetical protein
MNELDHLRRDARQLTLARAIGVNGYDEEGYQRQRNRIGAERAELSRSSRTRTRSSATLGS